MAFGGGDLLALNKIIQRGNDSDASTAITKISSPYNPASIVGNVLTTRPEDINEKKIPSDPKAIWADDEIPEKIDVIANDPYDTRKRPKFDLLYKQNISSQDMYLGMSGKNSSSASCKFLVVRIQFPGAKSKDLELDVTSNKLVAHSKDRKLVLSLPHDVRDKEGKAQWDSSKETLSVTLPIVRDLML